MSFFDGEGLSPFQSLSNAAWFDQRFQLFPTEKPQKKWVKKTFEL